MIDRDTLKGTFLGSLMVLVLALGVWPVSASQLSLPQTSEAWRSTSAFATFGGGHIHTVPAAAFTADGANPDSQFFPFGSGYFRGNSQNYGCLEAPVYLPDGATISGIFASVYDNDANRGISLNLRRVDNFNGGTDTMASMSTSAATASMTIQVLNDDTIDHPVIDHPDYSYYLTVCLGSSDIRLYSVRIGFYEEVFMPVLPSNS